MTAPGQSPARNLLEIIADGRTTAPDLDLLTFVDISPEGELRQEIRSYDNLWINGGAVADGLQSENMGARDSFALVMQNHPEFVEAMVGSSFVGTIYVPVDPRLAGEKLAYMLRFSECRGAIVAQYALRHVLEVAAGLPKLEWIWVVGASSVRADGSIRISSYSEILARRGKERSLIKIDPETPMQMLFTSGTTADPKAILSSHARFMYVSHLRGNIGLRANDRPYTGLSLTHANAQLMTLGNALAMGLRAVISRRFSRSRLWQILTCYECTTFNLLGGMAIAIFAEPPGRYDRSHKVRFVLSAGMPMFLWREFSERFGISIFEFFGTAEGGLTVNPQGSGPVGSIGKPPEGLLCAVLDQSDRELPPGELGELCFRNADGSVAPVAYYKDQNASDEKTRGGWFRSGDMGWKDSEGWVYFAHRSGTAIRRNGEFISAGDVEAIIAECPDVLDVHVYGVATLMNAPGECEVVAAVVPVNPTVFDSSVLFEWCRQRLNTNGCPAYIQLVSEIPKTASEKPQDRFLLAMLNGNDAKVFGANGLTSINQGEKK